jgi:hypothetical protein
MIETVTPGGLPKEQTANFDLIDFKDINKNFLPKNTFQKQGDNLESPSKVNISFDPTGFLANVNKAGTYENEKKQDSALQVKSKTNKTEELLNKDEDDHWSIKSSDQDTIQDNNQNDDADIKNILHGIIILIYHS